MEQLEMKIHDGKREKLKIYTAVFKASDVINFNFFLDPSNPWRIVYRISNVID